MRLSFLAVAVSPAAGLQLTFTQMRCIPPTLMTRCAVPVASIFDLFKESEEAKAAKEAQWKAQQDVLERRRNPEKLRQYNAEVDARRANAAQKDADLKKLQKGEDSNALEEWRRLRAEGKLQASDDMVREAGERSWGGEGLVADRIDEKLPFIDAGYVDESQPNIMGVIGKMFGQGKK